MLSIDRYESLGRDETIIVVKFKPSDIKDDLDTHALVTTLDQLRVKLGHR